MINYLMYVSFQTRLHDVKTNSFDNNVYECDGRGSRDNFFKNQSAKTFILVITTKRAAPFHWFLVAPLLSDLYPLRTIFFTIFFLSWFCFSCFRGNSKNSENPLVVQKVPKHLLCFQPWAKWHLLFPAGSVDDAMTSSLLALSKGTSNSDNY